VSIEQNFRNIIEAIGEDPDRNGLQETPKRFAKAIEEMCSSVGMTDNLIKMDLSRTFEDDADGVNRYGDMIIVRDIFFSSLCEHHFLPFFGTACVGYIPHTKVIGISKIARLVELLSKRPQIQERITNDTARLLMEMLTCHGVMVVLNAYHTCMSSRGIKKPDARTVTSCTLGAFRQDSATRQEFLSLIGG